ncbi:MAG TPA: cytochrome c [Gammaproteobacteria bacterium]|jgi:cytochrome c553
MRIRAFTLGLALACMALAAHADGDAAKGKVESYTCIGCHGIPNYTNNYPTYRVPKLAGQHAAYIVQALKEYKAGDRAHNTMHAQASSLSEQQMQDIAAYFESLGHAPSGQ